MFVGVSVRELRTVGTAQVAVQTGGGEKCNAGSARFYFFF